MFRVGFVIPKPLSPKHRSTFLPLQHTATLISSVDSGLGKSASSNIVLDNPYVSRRHARIVVRRGHFEIEDLGSKNGTSVNGTLLGNRRVRLRYGDRIELGQGQVILKFQHLDSTLTLPAGSRNAAELRTGSSLLNTARSGRYRNPYIARSADLYWWTFSRLSVSIQESRASSDYSMLRVTSYPAKQLGNKNREVRKWSIKEFWDSGLMRGCR